MGDASPFDFFRQECCHPDAETRTSAMEKVGIIAAMMGPDKTRNEMIPFLQSKIDDFDQVLLILSEKLGKFLSLVGGENFAHSLIPLFEALCEVEEITVRKAVVGSICTVLKQISPSNSNQVQSFFEFFKRVSSEEAGELFYARVSSCYIVADVYRLLADADRNTVRDIFTRLCRDELPIVRRAASGAFVDVAKLSDPASLTGDLLSLLKTLVADENQTIQVNGVAAIPTYAKLLKAVNATGPLSSDVLPLVRAFADDPSWRVRLALSKDYGVFATTFAPADVSADVFASLIQLIQDPEPEVRQTSILEVLPFLDIVGATQFIGELAPAAVSLSDDPVPTVRKLLAELCVDVAAKVGPEAVAMHLSDLVIKLMDDEDPMVRLRILKKLPVIAEEAPSLCTRLTEYLKAMFSHSCWRVRKELLLSMPAVVKHMGQEYFVDHFLQSVLVLLKDGVDEVRVACARCVPQIAAVSNVTWLFEAIFPEVRGLCQDDYLIRLTMVAALEGLLALETVGHSYHAEVLQLLLQLAADKVPNVRLFAIQGLSAVFMLPHLSEFRPQIDPVISELQNDTDSDVKYFASLAADRAQ